MAWPAFCFAGGILCGGIAGVADRDRHCGGLGEVLAITPPQLGSTVDCPTVVEAEGWLCDAMATTVMVGEKDSAKWFGQPELTGYQVFAVNRHEQSAWEI
jgi:hypothetical protein